MSGFTTLARWPAGRVRAGLGGLAVALAVTAAGAGAARAASGAAPAPAVSAGTGGLVYRGCIGDLTGCTPTIPGGALDGATALAATPAGTDLYAAAFGDDVSHFRIDRAGNLIYAGCIGDLAGCTQVTSGALHAAAALALSGPNLYAAAIFGDDVSHFRIDRAGNLIYAGCIGNLAGCTPVTAGALDGADGVAVAPGGRNLYVAALIANVVSHFRIDAAGNLIYAGCIGNLSGCTPVTAHALDAARGVAVAPGGRDLYVAAAVGNALTHFKINRAGDLIFAGCTGDRARCTRTVPRTALDGARGVAVTPAGTGLYATSQDGNVVSHFKIDKAGNLIFAGCIGDHRGCTRTRTRHALDGASGVALTTSGPPQAYVTSENAGVVSHFRIDSAGNLIYAGCTGDLAGCTRITPQALGGAAGLAVTGSRAHLYVAAESGNAVIHFKITR